MNSCTLKLIYLMPVLPLRLESHFKISKTFQIIQISLWDLKFSCGKLLKSIFQKCGNFRKKSIINSLRTGQVSNGDLEISSMNTKKKNRDLMKIQKELILAYKALKELSKILQPFLRKINFINGFRKNSAKLRAGKRA